MKIFSCVFFLILGLMCGAKKDIWLKWFKDQKSQSVSLLPVTEHKPFVFIIPSYNNGEWVEKNLRSIFEQKYDNFRVIYIDDASSDETLNSAKSLIVDYGQEHRVQILHNETNRGTVENVYRAAHTCLDQEIIIICDGDDWLAHEHVLQRLNEKYMDPSVWATYGSYIEYPTYSYTVANFASRLPSKIISQNKVREFSKEHWCISHMRTFYAGLFKQIRLEDIVFEGKYFDVAADVAFMIPIAEMAAEHLHFVEDIFYIYNRASALNDNKLRAERQKLLTQHILNLKTYSRLSSPLPQEIIRDVHVVVFSSDGPMQLYAFLESVQRYTKNVHALTVLYQTSSSIYEKGYAEVKQAFPYVRFVQQGEQPLNDFKPLMLKILNESLEKFVVWAVDEIVIADEIDFAYGAIQLDKTGGVCFCYRLGQGADSCNALKTQQGNPPLICVEKDVFAWGGEPAKGEGYTTSLGLAMYRKEQLLEQLKNWTFTHPHSLEAASSHALKSQGYSLCHGQTKIVHIPIKGGSLSENRYTNRYCAEELLSKFQEGLKIDIGALQRIKNCSAHSDYAVQFIPR